MSAISSSSASPPHDRRDGHETARRWVGAGEALRRYPFVALLPVLVLAALGVAAGLQSNPTYKATSELAVRPLAPNIAQLPGAVQAAEDLATNESRLITSDGITAPLARQFGTTTESIAGRISATPIPNSTIIKIQAEANSAASAVALANATASRFTAYVVAQIQSNTDAAKILRAYHAASVDLGSAQAAKQAIERNGSSAPRIAREEASATVDGAQLRRQALAAQYQTIAQSHATAPSVEPFVMATTASNNRTSGLEIFGFAGVVAGMLIGTALALVLSNRRLRPAGVSSPSSS